MCGIFAYTGGQTNAPLLVFQGLQKLDYRGYDSWGVAAQDAGTLHTFKTIGKIEDATAEQLQQELGVQQTSLAIGHTRWATHGGVTTPNAHPHLDNTDTIAVVHNGIIENYQELRKELEGRGIVFRSETDSEVIPNLIAKYLQQGTTLIEAVRATTAHLHGRYAFVVLHKTLGTLVGVRHGSPLILGKGQGEFFLASDVPAFLEHTRMVNYIDDGEMVVIESDSVSVTTIAGDAVTKKDITIDWQAEDTEKGDYAHFMLKEIMEQKETIRRAIDQDDASIMEVAKAIKEARGVFISGCGTAAKVAHASQYFFSQIADRHINFEVASEFPLYHHFLKPESLLIVISQSGETADVLEAIEAAKSKGSKVLAITNVQGSTIDRASDYTLLIKAGPEKAVASTKAATSQLSIMLLIAYAVAGKLTEGKQVLMNAQGELNDILNPNYLNYIQDVAKTIADQDHAFIIGKASNYPMALEASIKIQEVSYIHAQGFAGGELKHGPIALIQEGTPCIALIANDETKADIISNAVELKARGAHIIGVSPEKNDIFDQWIHVPDCGAASSIVSLIPIQLLAYYLAVHRGNNPDKPRNLAKSVTVK